MAIAQQGIRKKWSRILDVPWGRRKQGQNIEEVPWRLPNAASLGVEIQLWLRREQKLEDWRYPKVREEDEGVRA